MKTLKFRAMIKGSIGLLPVILIDFANGVEIEDIYDERLEQYFYEWDKVIALEQYTGLKDKNGKEIYEGDIIKSEDMIERGDGDYDPMIGKVVFYDSAFQVKDVYDNYSYYWMTEIDMEVIGNIHEK